MARRTIVESRLFSKRNNSPRLRTVRSARDPVLWATRTLALATVFGCLVESMPVKAQALGGAQPGPGVAVGTNASATDAGAVAVGLNSVASETGAVAVGADANAAEGAVAIGSATRTTRFTVAIGNAAVTTGENSVAIGMNSTDEGQNDVVSFGNSTQGISRRIIDLADGLADRDAATVGQIKSATASTQTYTDTKTAEAVAAAHDYSDQVGASTRKSANTYTDVVGTTTLTSAQDYTDRTADTLLDTLNTIGFNTTGTSHGTNAIAVGANATATGVNSASLGANSRAPAANSVAIGANATALRGVMDYLEPIGGKNTHSVGEVSVGASGQERQITNVAAGFAPTDAANVGQIEDGLSSALTAANDYTDTKLKTGMAQTLGAAKAYTDSTTTALARKTWGVDAKAAALASIPQAPYPGHSAVGFGIGGSHGQVGLAAGASHFMSDSSTIIKGGLSYGANAGLTMGGGLSVVLN